MKFRRKLSLIAVVLAVFFAAAAVFFTNRFKGVSAAWFDDNFLYRQTVAITNAGSAVTDYQIQITMSTTALVSASKLQSDCDDIRVTDLSGKLLPHWVEPGTCNGASTLIWVRVPSIPTTGQQLYIYYGNPTATTVWETSDVFVNDISDVHGAWTLDETSGNRADSSGDGNTLTDINTVTSATGKYSNAGQFTNANSEALRRTDGTSLSTGDIDFTVAAWVYLDSKTAARTIYARRDGGTENEFSFQYHSGVDRFLIHCFDSAGNFIGGAQANTFGSPSTATWYFVVAWHNQSTNTTYIQVNNGTVDYSALTGTITDSTSQSRIGDYAGSNFMDGRIDEVRFYKKILTADERTNLYDTTFYGYFTSNYANHELLRRYITSNPPAAGTPTGEEKGLGPVGAWRFDEGQGTAANDSSQNSNQGTLSGATLPTWQTEEQCVSGKCLYFGGSTSYVKVNDATNLRPTSITVGTWFRTNANSGDYDFVSKQYGTSSNVSFLIKLNSGVLQFTVCNTSGTCVTAQDPSGVLPADTWFYLVGTYDGTSAKLYKNGVLIHQKYGTVTIGYDTNPIFIGARSIDATVATPDFGFVQGFIDEPKIYDYVRTATQIKLDYSNSAINKGAATEFGRRSKNVDGTLSNGLVGYWKLDESSSTRADSSGNAYTLSDWNTVTSNPGKFGKGGQFTRANSESLYVADNAKLSVTGDYTISGWFYQDSTTTGDRCIICKGDVSNNKREFYILRTTGGLLGFSLATDGSTVTSVTSSEFSNTASVWNFVVAWYDSTARTINIQINGGKVDSIAFAATPYETDSQFMIGGIGNTAGTVLSFFDGRIDDVRIYKRVLSGAERQLLYNFAPGPVGYWNFEEGSGSTAYDLSGNGGNGTITAGAGGYIQGKFGKAYNFDAALTKIDAGSAAILDDMTTFTAEAWIYPKSVGETAGRIFDKENATLANGWQYSVDTTTTMLFYRNYNSGANAISCSAPIAGLNKWQHVAVVWDGTASCTGVTFYLNGVKQTTTTNASPSGSYDTDVSNSLIIGNGTNQTRTFDGYIDEAKIYYYPRSSNQIIEDMNGGHPAGGSPVGSQAGYWKFDEGYGTTVFDSSQNNIRGTMTNFTSPPSVTSGWTKNGKFGKALSFASGNPDYVTLGTDVAALDITSDITISAWVNIRVISSEKDIVAKRGVSGNYAYRLFVDGNGKVNFEISSDGTTLTSVVSTTTLATGRWYYVAGVYSAGSALKVYVNGALDNSNFASIPTSIFNSSAVVNFGAERAGAANFWVGMLDEIKVFAGALTDEQVRIDYNEGQNIKLGTLGVSTLDGKTASDSAGSMYCLPGDTSTCNPPVAEWKFEEGTGNANDTSGNAGTLTNTNGATYVPGKYGKGAQMVSTSTQYFTMTDSASISSGDISLTWQIWAYLDSTSADRPLIYKYNSGATVGEYSMRFTSGSYFTCGIKQSADSVIKTADATQFGVPAIQTWHLVTCVYDSSADTLQIFVDSKLDSTTTSVSGPADTTGDLFIGRIASDYMNGRVDEARVYKYARTPSQIAWDYNRGLPVAWWKMNECQGTVLNDSVGTNSATLTVGTGAGTGHQDSAGTCTTSASTVWYNGVSGKHSYSVNMDGIDDYAQVLGPSFLGDQQGSVSMWIYPTSAAADNIFAVTDKDTSYQNAFIWALDPGSPCDTEIDVIRGGVFNVVLHGSATGFNCADSTWHHLVITSDGSKYQFYLNGQKLLSYATSGTNNGKWFGYLTGGDNVSIGGDIESSSLANPMPGKYDDVRVYSYALTDYQVRLLYNENAAVRFGPTSGAP